MSEASIKSAGQAIMLLSKKCQDSNVLNGPKGLDSIARVVEDNFLVLLRKLKVSRAEIGALFLFFLLRP